MHTKSEDKHTNPHTADFASKYSTRTPPKDLSEMVSKVKDEKNDENFCLVRTPNLSIQNPLNSILGEFFIPSLLDNAQVREIGEYV